MTDVLGPSSLTRPLEGKFKSLPAQAHDARLRYVIWRCRWRSARCLKWYVDGYASFVKLVAPASEYYDEAIGRFKSLCEGRKLIANIDYKEGNSLLHLRLIDPADPASAKGEASINADLVREGYASIERKGIPAKYIASYPSVVKQLQDSVKIAKRERQGMYEFGDVEEDD